MCEASETCGGRPLPMEAAVGRVLDSKFLVPAAPTFCEGHGWHSLLQAVCAALETLEKTFNEHWMLILETAPTPCFQCLRHTA